MSGASCTVTATSLPGCTSPTRCDEAWCLGPDSNRHGVAPKGFSYHCSFRCCMRGPCISWSGVYLCRDDTAWLLELAYEGQDKQVQCTCKLVQLEKMHVSRCSY